MPTRCSGGLCLLTLFSCLSTLRMPSASCDPEGQCKLFLITPSQTHRGSQQPNLWNFSEGVGKSSASAGSFKLRILLMSDHFLQMSGKPRIKKPGSHPDSCIVPAWEGLPVLKKPLQLMTLLYQPAPAPSFPSAWQPAEAHRSLELPGASSASPFPGPPAFHRVSLCSFSCIYL